jgi:hypothetical protein
MSYRGRQRLADIQAAIDAIRSHPQRGDLTDELNFDAVRIRLLETGEAVKALPDDLLATQQPSSPGGRSPPHARPPRPPLLRHRRQPCTILPAGEPNTKLLRIRLHDPARGVAKGQGRCCTTATSSSLRGDRTDCPQPTKDL